MNQKRAVIGKLSKKYRGVKTKSDRIKILDDVVEITGYHRHYAAWLLRNYDKRKTVSGSTGEPVRLIVGLPTKRQKVDRPRTYDESVKRELVFIWEWFDQMCGKRLVALLPDILPVLVQQDRVTEGDDVYRKLIHISAATIDRILKPERAKRRLTGTTHTKPSSILKSQIPIIISSELNVTEPGHYQLDLVGHDGGNPNGHFSFTLNAVELSSGWVEPRILQNKAHRWAKEAIKDIKSRCPLPIASLHSDNDSVFINEHLQSWCVQQHIPYSRARPYHSNDTCYVEQKNYNIVRQAIGYARYDSQEEVAVIGKLYENLRLLINFFYPSMKLLKKYRVGSRIHKTYDTPKSPFRRILDSPQVPNTLKIKLRYQKRHLDPFALKKTIASLQGKLLELVRRKNMKILHPGPNYPQALEKHSKRLYG